MGRITARIDTVSAQTGWKRCMGKGYCEYAMIPHWDLSKKIPYTKNWFADIQSLLVLALAPSRPSWSYFAVSVASAFVKGRTPNTPTSFSIRRLIRAMNQLLILLSTSLLNLFTWMRAKNLRQRMMLYHQCRPLMRWIKNNFQIVVLRI